MTCTACGQGLPQGALFCPYCGAAAPIPAPAQGGTAAGRAANAPCEAAPLPRLARPQAPPRRKKRPPGRPKPRPRLTHRAPARLRTAPRRKKKTAPGRPHRRKTAPARARRTARSPACACGIIFGALCCSASRWRGLCPWWPGPSASACAKKSAAFRARRCALRALCWPLCCLRWRWPPCCWKWAQCPCNAWCDGASLPTKRTAPAALRPPGRF